MKVRKYVLSDNCVIEMPKNARLLHVHYYKGRPCIWALVNEQSEEMDLRRFRIVETGISISSFGNAYIRDYVGSVVSGDVIRHVFEML